MLVIMKHSRVATRIVLLIAVLAFLGGCTVTYPYLELTVDPIYNGQDISFSYRFQSERSRQECQLYVSGNYVDNDQEVRLISPDEKTFRFYEPVKLPSEGVIVFQVGETGNYVLFFNVLTAKGRSETVLRFLSDYAAFEVQ